MAHALIPSEIASRTFHRNERGYHIARALLRLAHRSDLGHSTHITIDLALSRGELAELVGTTPSSVSRVLNRWKRQGILGVRRKTILVRSLKRMADFIEGNNALPGKRAKSGRPDGVGAPTPE